MMSYASRVRGSASPPKPSQGERFIAGLTGHLVTLELVSGSSFKGVLLQKTTANTFCLGQVQQILTRAERPTIFPFQDERLFDASEVARIKVRAETKADREESAGFRIDSEINSRSADGSMRSLEKWDAGDASAGPRATLEEAQLRPEDRGWDQFEVNQKLFGYKSSYAEEDYTTNLDRKSEFYRQHERMARKVAAEIQNQTTSNPHVAEERGHQVATEMDEEAMFSTVLDDASKPRLGKSDVNPSWRNRSDDVESPPIEPTNSYRSASPSTKSPIKKSKPESGQRSRSPPKAKSTAKEPVGKVPVAKPPVDVPKARSPVKESVQATDGHPIARTTIDKKVNGKPTESVKKKLNSQAKQATDRPIAPAPIDKKEHGKPTEHMNKQLNLQAKQAMDHPIASTSIDKKEHGKPTVHMKKQLNLQAKQATDNHQIATTPIDKTEHGKPTESVKKQLNPEVKSFHFNAGAKEFVPRFDGRITMQQIDQSCPLPVQIMGPMNSYGQYLPHVGPVSVGPIPYGAQMMVPIPAPGAFPIGAYGPVPMGPASHWSDIRQATPARRNKQQQYHNHHQQQQHTAFIDGAEVPDVAFQTDGTVPTMSPNL